MSDTRGFSSSRSGRRAQTSIEYLFILAIAVLVITVIALVAQGYLTNVQNKKDTSDAMNSLYDLSSAAKEVYAQGEGSRKQVFVRLPSGYEPERSSVGNRSIQIRAYGTDYVSAENFNVHGSLPGAPGNYWVWVTSEGNRVRIGPAMMELSRNRIFLTMDRNTTEYVTFNVKNSWSRNIQVTSATTWTPSDVSMSGVPLSFSLDSNDTEQITLEFIAGEDSGGIYSGEIRLDARDSLGATETVVIPVTVYVSGSDYILQDFSGPVITSMSQDPNPAVKNAPLDITASASDENTGNHSIKGCSISADGGAWNLMVPEDGAYDQPNETVHYNFTDGFQLGIHSARAQCTDSLNNIGPMAYYIFNVSEADQLGPIITSLWHTGYPTTLSNISVGGIATDAYTGNSDIAYCNLKIDDGEWKNATASDGAFDSPTENFTYPVGSMTVGYHEILYQCADVIGNMGGIYNDTFGVVDVDLMLVLDRSGSMIWTVVNSTSSSTVVQGSSTGWSYAKNFSVTNKNGDLANLSVELRSTASNCLSSYEARINDDVVASGNTTSTSTSYDNLVSTINVSSYELPYEVSIWIKRNATGCYANTRYSRLSQRPLKLDAAKYSSKEFLDISGSATYAGLVSYSTSATTDQTIAIMDPANQLALKNAIDSLAALGSTCIECGLEYAANELVSARGRPTSTKVIVMLTDGVGNMGISGSSCGTECSVAGAVYCRDRNITVYTIGFGTDVDEIELTNIALLTHGEYYFAPNAETLNEIFRNIGK